MLILHWLVLWRHWETFVEVVMSAGLRCSPLKVHWSRSLLDFHFMKAKHINSLRPVTGPFGHQPLSPVTGSRVNISSGTISRKTISP